MTDSQNNSGQKAVCPECDTPLNLQPELPVGKIIECTTCAVQSEVIELNPLKLAPLEEEK